MYIDRLNSDVQYPKTKLKSSAMFQQLRWLMVGQVVDYKAMSLAI